MTDEMKLLRAFIDASGYDVETIIDDRETPITKQMGFANQHNLVVDDSCAFKRGDDDCYYLKPSFNVDYKVTKKQDETVKTNGPPKTFFYDEGKKMKIKFV